MRCPTCPLLQIVPALYCEQGCDITSATGSGVGTEGGALTLVGCSVHGCKAHGVALFGGLEEGSQGAAMPSAFLVCIVGRSQNGGFQQLP